MHAPKLVFALIMVHRFWEILEIVPQKAKVRTLKSNFWHFFVIFIFSHEWQQRGGGGFVSDLHGRLFGGDNDVGQMRAQVLQRLHSGTGGWMDGWMHGWMDG